MDKKYKKILFDVADTVSINEDIATVYLKEKGIDVSYYTQRGIKEIRRKEFLLKATQNLEKHQKLVANAIKKIKSAIPETLEGIENAIRLRNPAYQFRNLKELDENQLREILVDSEIIDLIEGMENND